MSQIPIPLELRTRPCTTHSRYRSHRSLHLVGSIWRKEPHVPQAPAPRASHSWSYSCHHLHLGRQLLLHPHVLANSSVQCIRTRPDWCRYSRYPCRFQHSGRCLHRAVAAVYPPRSQQGIAYRLIGLNDCWLWLARDCAHGQSLPTLGIVGSCWCRNRRYVLGCLFNLTNSRGQVADYAHRHCCTSFDHL
jgi:hypothetical protein